MQDNDLAVICLALPNTENGKVVALHRRRGRPAPPRRRANRASRSREHLTPEEVESLIKAAAKGRYGSRDATLILIGYRHGLRVSELIALRWDQGAGKTLPADPHRGRRVSCAPPCSAGWRACRPWRGQPTYASSALRSTLCTSRIARRSRSRWTYRLSRSSASAPVSVSRSRRPERSKVSWTNRSRAVRSTSSRATSQCREHTPFAQRCIASSDRSFGRLSRTSLGAEGVGLRSAL